MGRCRFTRQRPIPFSFVCPAQRLRLLRWLGIAATTLEGVLAVKGHGTPGHAGH